MDKTFQPGFLKGKTALITGGGTGICYNISLALNRYGCTICIMSRKQKVIDQAVETLKQQSGNTNIYGTTCDVRNYQQIEKACDFFLTKVEKIDILVNGAAGNFLAPFDNLSPNAFKTVIDIDLLGTFNASKAVYEKSMKQHGGNIINISAYLYAVLMQSHAGSAKAAIDNLTKALAVELGPRNIRVNGIAPGSIEGTEGLDKLSGGLTHEKMIEVLPIKRLGRKEDIASATLFLVSDAASYINGHTLQVDGGVQYSFPNFPLLSDVVKQAWANPKL